MTTQYSLKPVHRNRLEKLIAFLRQLPRKRFNFAIVRNEPPRCGAVGCAIGYLPNVFPSVFKSIDEIALGSPWTHGVGFRGDVDSDFNGAAEWMTGMEFGCRLFIPGRQSVIDRELPSLPESATPKQVAAMLEKFIKLHSKGAPQC